MTSGQNPWQDLIFLLSLSSWHSFSLNISQPTRLSWTGHIPFPATKCALMSFWSGVDGVYTCLFQPQDIPTDLFKSLFVGDVELLKNPGWRFWKDVFHPCVWRKQLEKWSQSEQNQVRRLLSVFVWAAAAAAASLGFQRTEVKAVITKDSRAGKPGRVSFLIWNLVEESGQKKIRNLETFRTFLFPVAGRSQKNRFFSLILPCILF